jgi:hypothetical protein
MPQDSRALARLWRESFLLCRLPWQPFAKSAVLRTDILFPAATRAPGPAVAGTQQATIVASLLCWWRRQESNPRAQRCQHRALPPQVRLHIGGRRNKNCASRPILLLLVIVIYSYPPCDRWPDARLWYFPSASWEKVFQVRLQGRARAAPVSCFSRLICLEKAPIVLTQTPSPALNSRVSSAAGCRLRGARVLESSPALSIKERMQRATIRPCHSLGG